jgi:Flp pilus assembly protein protease CpaA
MHSLVNIVSTPYFIWEEVRETESIKEWLIAVPVFIAFVVAYVAFVEFSQYMLAVSIGAYILFYIPYLVYKAVRKQG